MLSAQMRREGVGGVSQFIAGRGHVVKSLVCYSTANLRNLLNSNLSCFSGRLNRPGGRSLRKDCL